MVKQVFATVGATVSVRRVKLGVVWAAAAGAVVAVAMLARERMTEAPLSFVVASAFVIGFVALDLKMLVSLMRTRLGSALVGGFIVAMIWFIALVPKDDGLEFLGLLYPIPIVVLAAIVEAFLAPPDKAGNGAHPRL